MSFIYNCQFLHNKLHEGAQLIDVRSPIEFSRGALHGAINMPIEKFQHQMDDIETDKPVLLYCRTGARSEMVKRFLVEQGYEDVHNIGGINQYAGC